LEIKWASCQFFIFPGSKGASQLPGGEGLTERLHLHNVPMEKHRLGREHKIGRKREGRGSRGTE